MRRQVGLVILLILAALAIAACGAAIPGLSLPNASNSSPSRPTTAKIGELAPEINLKSLNSDPIVLSQLVGKPVIVNFWATWCGPCREEFPALVRFYKKHQVDGLVIVGVNFQDENSDEGVQTFMRNTLVNFPIVRDTGERVGRMYGIRGLPTSFFIDKKSVLRDVVVGGPMTDDYLDQQWGKINQ